MRDRTGGNHLLGSLVRVLGEVLVEEASQLVDLVLEARRGSPAVLGVQQLRRHAGAAGGHVQVEDVVGLVLGLGQLAVVDGVQNGTRVLERAALAAGGGASADPSGVQQPGVGVVLRDLLGQHAGVAHGVQGQERLREARREGRLGLGHAVLGTGHLGGVAGDEVEHGLLGSELGNRGEHTTGVAGEEDDVLGVLVGDAGDLGVFDVLNGVGAGMVSLIVLFEWVRDGLPASVLGQGRVVVVDHTADGVEDDVLQDGSEADGVVDVGLLLGGETNALGVASTLDVEDTGVGPAVLVVTDQSTLGVGGQSGLAGSRQTEENSDIAVLALVGGRVQSQDVVLHGHLVEEDGEDTLLHLTGILGTQDDHLLLGEVDGNRRGRGHTLGETVGREGTGVVDHVVGVEVLQLLRRRTDEHVAHEQSMVGTGADHTDADAVSLVPAGETVDDIDTVASVEVVNGALTVDPPDLNGKWISEPALCR